MQVRRLPSFLKLELVLREITVMIGLDGVNPN
jgi:hypothetical protein